MGAKRVLVIMSLCLSALTIFLLCFSSVQSNNWIQAQSYPSLLVFELPEIDGSAVDDTCKIFNPGPTSSTTKPTTRPITREQVVISTKKQVVQLSPRKPVPKVPVRTWPTDGGPISNHNTNQVLRLFHSFLASIGGRLAGSQPKEGLNVMSSSDESVAAWKIGAVTSEDSSDES
ncbi:hypothetical protein CRENBAI_005873 [Crenichthys baileyi]|uniref:Uncharacterized protein n=1 Tax=Crenichthys baileyi TaxID=28760 RepID=A0AAV9RVJ7_9TELE